VSDADGKNATGADRQMVVFGLALVAAFLLAVFLPDLVPAAAHGEAATLAHARVVSIVQPSPIPSEARFASAQPFASALYEEWPAVNGADRDRDIVIVG
jgi:hypothetical protein